MNWDRVEGNWKDLDVAAGKRDQLIGKIQNRYGVAKEDAEKQLDEWTRRSNF